MTPSGLAFAAATANAVGMYSYIYVMAGGALGAVARFGLTRALSGLSTSWPWPTFTANLVGGLLMGVLTVCLSRGADSSEPLRLFAGVGLLGGFTTFSAFSLEMAQMVEGGKLALAGGYALASVLLALFAVFAGIALAKAIFA